MDHLIDADEPATLAVKRGWRAAVQGFGRDENGTMLVFSLMLFTLMVMMGGIAVDLMRYENMRTALQNTTDRSTLAAAALTQSLEPEEVVHDYFEKAGLVQYLTNVNVAEGINYRQVTADASAATRPFFLHMIGIDEFDAPAHSMAEQRITNVEIVLVLDVSGSMAGSKLVNLKSAASEFVSTVLSSDSEDRISIALVPYNGQVNLGTILRPKYNATMNPHVTNVNCIDLPSSVYSQSGMSRTLEMPMTAHADTFSSTSQTTTFVSHNDTDFAVPNAANRWCPPSTTNVVRLPTKSIATLQSQISGLTAIGATSINAGLKWGTAMLDPGSRGMFTELVAENQIPGVFAGRPFDYTDDEAMKIIVLMTDGEHFAEERVTNSFKSGISTIYRSSNDGNYSIFHASRAGPLKFWTPHRTEWRATAWTNNATPAVQLTWPQVWAALRPSWVAWQMHARAFGTNNATRSSNFATAMTAMRTQTATTAMDSQLQTACTKAKTDGLIIYGIAFEAPTNGAAQIAGCATTSAHYFNANGLQIQTAFRAIASNISQLRLTQ